MRREASTADVDKTNKCLPAAPIGNRYVRRIVPTCKPQLYDLPVDVDLHDDADANESNDV